MRLYENTRPSQGVSYRPWAERVKELLDEHDLEMPPNHYLHSYYHQNFSYEEVLFKQQFKTRKNVWMEVHVRHENGKYSNTFNTSDQAKEFFKRFPELREDLNSL
ncbi:hypothetical protein [Ekhidna sp.]|uniref:hypothetical protein n=1 Tax=Ekhidna sp. TaxID=2608089 RepID=UPI003298BF94